MDAAEWDLWVHDAITGAPIQKVTPVESTWTTSLAGDGSSTETFLVNDADEPWPAGEVARLFEPNSRLLVRTWPDVVVMYAQKIDEWVYDEDSGRVTVTTSDLVRETDWRMIAGVSADKDTSVVIANQTPAAAVGATLRRMMQWSPDWAYPIDTVPAAAGTISGFWEFWKKLRISDIINQVHEQAGVLTYLQPYSTDNHVRFQQHTAAAISLGASRFNLGADDRPVGGVTYRVNGERQVTGILGVGNGTGVDQATAHKDLTGGGGLRLIPIRDTKQSFPDQAGVALQRATDAYFAENLQPVRQWSVGSFTISDQWSAAHAVPGQIWTLESHGDPVIPDGDNTLRVIKVSGGSGRVLKVEVQSA